MFQVDAALGAEEMVENLTTKCLDLEDQVKKIKPDKCQPCNPGDLVLGIGSLRSLDRRLIAK